jgi:serine/threonine-protein kinase RsbW
LIRGALANQERGESVATLDVMAQVENLATSRRWLEEITADLGANPSSAGDLIQAVDEAITNIIVHGYPAKPGSIEIEVTREGEDLVVRLRDLAPPFDPTAIPPPDLTLSLEERPPGGLGLFLIRKLTDRISYRARPLGGNEFTLVKKAF